MQKWGGMTKDNTTRAGQRNKGTHGKGDACRRGKHMYMVEKGHQQMKKKKEKRKDAPGCCSVARRGKTRRGRRTRAGQRVKRGQRDTMRRWGEATRRRRHLKRGQCDTARATRGGNAARATRQRRRGESDASTRRRQQGGKGDAWRWNDAAEATG
jgi:hypothetical protein